VFVGVGPCSVSLLNAEEAMLGASGLSVYIRAVNLQFDSKLFWIHYKSASFKNVSNSCLQGN